MHRNLYVIYFQTAAEKKRAAKAKAAAEQAQKEAKAASAEQAKSALSSMAADDEPIPTEPEAREQYFMENLQKGEALFRQGPEYFEMSAMSFYRAMKVYPNPMDLLVLFQRSVPEPVFNMLMELMAADIKKKQEEYFDTYPKREMNVKITQSIDNQTLKRGLEALEDFEEGQVIFSEEPLVAAIDPALESGTFCSFCAKQFAEGEEAVVDEDFDKWVYCCAVCYKKARDEYNQAGYKRCLGAKCCDQQEFADLTSFFPRSNNSSSAAAPKPLSSPSLTTAATKTSSTQ